jgi:hypothetical protein
VYEDVTENREYQLPHPDNYLEDDAERLRNAITAIDEDMHQLGENIGQTGKDIQSITTALSSKADLEEGVVPLEQLPLSQLGKLDVVYEGFGDNTGKREQAMPASDKQFILVPGLGIFRYDGNSDDPVDGETCIAPASGPGRWLLTVPDTDHVLAWIHDEAAFAAKELKEKTEALSEEIPVFLTASASLDFPSIAAQSSTTLTVTVAGASLGDTMTATPPTLAAGLVFAAYISAADTVTVRMTNVTAAAINPAAGTWTVSVIKN